MSSRRSQPTSFEYLHFIHWVRLLVPPTGHGTNRDLQTSAWRTGGVPDIVLGWGWVCLAADKVGERVFPDPERRESGSFILNCSCGAEMEMKRIPTSRVGTRCGVWFGAEGDADHCLEFVDVMWWILGTVFSFIRTRFCFLASSVRACIFLQTVEPCCRIRLINILS
jgi:hypothetical protein